MEKEIKFETFRNLGSYEISGLKRDIPSAINFLSYRKFEVIIKPIEESNDVYIERLLTLLALPENKGYTTSQRIKDEIKKLQSPDNKPAKKKHK